MPLQRRGDSPLASVIRKCNPVKQPSPRDLVRAVLLPTASSLCISVRSRILVNLLRRRLSLSLADLGVSTFAEELEPEGRGSEVVEDLVVVD